ncbi:MAG TPA: nucleoside 2-deoxyribosyltransferase [Candidatus Nitrosocosmicus sp.]|jgi:nucleoside 2-deoxyribosyltransferase|nr:nucleoside 2-deoxyribosyltransferase [Candidatus Nitrosocosmicus sp.]
MLCGSIGYGGINEIKNLYTLLVNKGFSVIDHIVHTGTDYSHIKDFRDKQDLSFKIINSDLKYIENSDAIVAIANGPSYGTAIEIFVAKNLGKKIILFAKDPVPTPWPVYFSDHIATSEEQLYGILRNLDSSYK